MRIVVDQNNIFFAKKPENRFEATARVALIISDALKKPSNQWKVYEKR